MQHDSSPSGSRVRVLGRSALVWCLALLGIAELVWHMAAPYRTVPHASTVSRFPVRKVAGWPEYLRPRPGDKDDGLVVLISNSQGISPEIEDPERIYPARMRAALENRSPALHLENWSVGGAPTVAIELLAMHALSRGAKRVIFCVSPWSIDARSELDLDFGRPQSDTDLLAGHPVLWGPCQRSTFAETTTRDDLLERTLALQSDLVRSRELWLNRLAKRLPARLVRPLVGRVIAKWQWRAGRRAKRGKDEDAPDHERFKTFQQLMANLNREFKSHGARYIWIWQPLKFAHKAGMTRLHPMLDMAPALVGEAGHRFVDLSSALVDSKFGKGSHLSEEGHAEMARLMIRIVLEDLE